MSLPTSATDILNDIDFEIIQGFVSADDLGPAIQAIHQFKDKSRAELFHGMKATDSRRESLSRLFQINDMLLALIQQMALNFQSLRAEIARLRQHPEPAFLSARPGSSYTPSSQAVSPMDGTAASAIPTPFPQPDFPGLEMRSPDEIAYIMRDDAIRVDLQAHPIRIPIIGWLLTQLRIFYQRPALFYTQLLSTRQAPVNRVLGDHILYLESIVQMQQQQIEALSVRLSSQDEGVQNAPGN